MHIFREYFTELFL